MFVFGSYCLTHNGFISQLIVDCGYIIFADYSDYGDFVFYSDRFSINLDFQEIVAGKETES